jgi:hypothetical protein
MGPSASTWGQTSKPPSFSTDGITLDTAGATVAVAHRTVQRPASIVPGVKLEKTSGGYLCRLVSNEPYIARLLTLDASCVWSQDEHSNSATVLPRSTMVCGARVLVLTTSEGQKIQKVTIR